MKTTLFLFLNLILSPLTFADAIPGNPAPDFSIVDAQGKTRTLHEFAGHWLVLEWFNKDCPFVKKHYGSDNMQKLQRKYTEKGVSWVSVISSAPGKQGYMNGPETLAALKERKAAVTATLLDPKGEMGRAYGAKTTPHLFIIDPKGVVYYAGAIDSIASTDSGDIAKAKNYVADALEAGLSGRAAPEASTKSYGCSVKY